MSRMTTSRLIVSRTLKELCELDSKLDISEDMIALIVPDVRYIYMPLERLNTRVLVIGMETYSSKVDLSDIKEFMRIWGLKHFMLINKSTEFLESDIHKAACYAKVDEVITL